MKLEDLIEKHRFSEIPRYLEKHRAEAEQTDAFLRTPLHRLCEQGRNATTPPRSSSSSSSSHDDDAVVLRDMAKATEALLDAYPGALTSTDEDGRTPLHCACIATPRAEPMVVKILLREFVRIATKPEKQANRKREEESSGINNNNTNNTLLLSATKSMRRSRTRGQRNTPLHELCQWGDWSSTIATATEEDPELEVLRLLLRVDPSGGLARNRSGITPLNLVFGERYRSLSARELSDVVRCNSGSGSIGGTNHEKNHELHREFPRRWRAVEALVRAAATAVGTTGAAVSGVDAICNNARHPCNNNTNDDFLFLHATLSVDRTFPIFDVVVQKYGSLQSRIRGTERGTRCDDATTTMTINAQHPRTDYPLAIAARSPMFAYGISDFVIRSLIELHPEAASLPTSSGRTVLLEAIYGGKGFASRYDENNKNNHNNGGSSSLAAKKNDDNKETIGATGPLGSILRAYPGAINIPDRGNGLYPFAVAASIDRNKKEKQFCCASIATEANDVFALNNSYTLLRMAPHLLLLAAVQQQEEQDSD